MPDSIPMRGIRGTILICDLVDQTMGAKYHLCGTYNSRVGMPGETFQRWPLYVYGRIQAETAGLHRCEIILVDRNTLSNQPALLRLNPEFTIPDPNIPFEFSLLLADFSVSCPVDLGALAPGTAFALPLLVWFKVNGEDIATTPLTLFFQAPQGPPNDDHPTGTPDP